MKNTVLYLFETYEPFIYLFNFPNFFFGQRQTADNWNRGYWISGHGGPTVLQIRLWRLSSTSFPIHCSTLIILFNAETWSKLAEAVALQICIQEVLGSDLDPNTDCADCFSWFSSILKETARIMPLIKSWPLPSTSLPIHCSIIRLRYWQRR
jgi:hypothetical protein